LAATPEMLQASAHSVGLAIRCRGMGLGEHAVRLRGTCPTVDASRSSGRICRVVGRLANEPSGRHEGAALDISRFHGLIVSIHVIGVILFVVAHAVSAVVVLLVRRERDPVKLRRFLTLSRQSLLVTFIGLAAWFLGGILAGFSGNWWTSGRYWIWASLVLAVVLIGLMTPMGRIYLNRVREAVGIDPDRCRRFVEASRSGRGGGCRSFGPAHPAGSPGNSRTRGPLLADDGQAVLRPAEPCQPSV
jgi:hypothetical protein